MNKEQLQRIHRYQCRDTGDATIWETPICPKEHSIFPESYPEMNDMYKSKRTIARTLDVVQETTD